MSLTEMIFGKKGSAQVARERLRLVLEHERKGVPPPYFDAMQQEIIRAVQEVIKKYTDAEKIAVKNQDSSTLEIEIILEKR